MKLYDKIKEAMLNHKGIYCDFEKFTSYFGINTMNYIDDADELFQERVKCYDIHTWLCTDEMAGIEAYYMDGEFICIAHRQGRKYDWEFLWESYEQKSKVLSFIQSLPSADISERYCSDLIDKDISYEEFCELNRLHP